MARSVRDSALETRTARSRLKVSGVPYFKSLDERLHLGYRRGKTVGKWVMRTYRDGAYTTETIGAADDMADADGTAILSFRQAQELARARFVELAEKAAGKGPYTVADAMTDYLAHKADQGSDSKDARHRNKVHITPKLGTIEVRNLTTETIKKWHGDLAKAPKMVRTKKGRAQSFKAIDGEDGRRKRRASANRVLSILKAGLNLAWRNGKVPSDSAWRKVQPYEGVDVARVRYLTVAETQRLLNACTPEFRPLLQGALLSGARYGQLCALRVADFNPDAGTITVTTRKGRGVTKVVHIFLQEAGRKFFASMCAGRSGTELVFQRKNGEPWKASQQERFIEEASNHAAIVPPANFHITRHTYASHAVMNAVPLMVVAKNLGHSDTRMVEKHYGHLAPSFVKEAIEKGAPDFGITLETNVTGIR